MSSQVFALRIELLMGWYCAQAHDDRNWPEWPPHPARVFSALVAAWAEAGQDAAERDALEWLEGLPAPWIQASQATVRGIQPARSSRWSDKAGTVTTYVPVNDAFVVSPAGVPKQYERLMASHRKVETAKSDAVRTRAIQALDSQREKVRTWSENASKPSRKGSLDVLPDNRGKQPRTFPLAIPDDPVVHLIWPDVDSSEHAEVLDKLASRVPRLGHSSSSVSITVATQAPAATLEPASEGMHVRLPGPGQLAALVRAHGVHGGVQPRQLPFRSQMYRDVGQTRIAPVSELAGQWLVLEVVGREWLRLQDAMILAQAIRAALMSHAVDPIPTVLSGHEADGSPAARAHLAIVPLPFVGREHADGAIRGFALMLPRDASIDDRAAVAASLQSWGSSGGGDLVLALPGGRCVGLRLLVDDPLLRTLQRYRWSRPSRYWSTVTPMAFDRSPGRLWASQPAAREAAQRAAEEVVGLACERVGLPRPVSIQVMQSGGLVGVPNLRSFPVYESPGRKVRRVSAHVDLHFDEPVRGPLVLGAGRFFGMGLFAPMWEGSPDDATRS